MTLTLANGVDGRVGLGCFVGVDDAVGFGDRVEGDGDAEDCVAGPTGASLPFNTLASEVSVPLPFSGAENRPTVFACHITSPAMPTVSTERTATVTFDFRDNAEDLFALEVEDFFTPPWYRSVIMIVIPELLSMMIVPARRGVRAAPWWTCDRSHRAGWRSSLLN
jgi:hypothetical protein